MITEQIKGMWFPTVIFTSYHEGFRGGEYSCWTSLSGNKLSLVPVIDGNLSPHSLVINPLFTSNQVVVALMYLVGSHFWWINPSKEFCPNSCSTCTSPQFFYFVVGWRMGFCNLINHWWKMFFHISATSFGQALVSCDHVPCSLEWSWMLFLSRGQAIFPSQPHTGLIVLKERKVKPSCTLTNGRQHFYIHKLGCFGSASIST